MATVWLAYDLKHDRQVAVKVLHPHLAAVLGAGRFLQEIKTTANLQHPHILPLFDSGDAEGVLFYVMPFVDGESLRQRITREKQLPVSDAVRIAAEVAGALDYAHRQGVIHRDIKPENILLHEGSPLVADFGIALAPSEGGGRLTETGIAMGTSLYMSPEQALGERELDARSDVYAVGATLYEMLTGAPPFTGPSAQAILAKVITEKPVPPSRLRREIPAHVEDAVLTALQKDPANRFATAAALQSALEHGGPTSMRRQRTLPAWTIAAVVFVIILAGGAYFATHRGHTGYSPLGVSIAAEPFVIQDPADTYLGDEMPQEILEALKPVAGLTVLPLVPASRVRENPDKAALAKDLDVTILLTGIVVRDGKSLRITVRRFDRLHNTDLKPVTFTDSSTFALVDSVTANVVSGFKLVLTQTQLALSRAGRTTNPLAHDTLMRANWYARKRTPQDLAMAVSLFNTALRLDSTYADAWAGLAQTHNLRAVFLGQAPTPIFDSAFSAAQRALELDSNSADAHKALGFYHVMHDRNYAEGGRELTKALRLNPNDPETWLFDAWYYAATNHLDSTVESLQHAKALDTTAAVIRVRLGEALWVDGKTMQAENELNQVLALEPTHQPARAWLAQVYATAGRCDRALEQTKRITPGGPMRQYDWVNVPITWAVCGSPRKATAYVDSMAIQARKGQYVSGYALAMVYAALGDTANAHAWLSNAVKNQDWVLFILRVDPLFRDYRSKPWFQAMLR